jgi:hypothetical protein
VLWDVLNYYLKKFVIDWFKNGKEKKDMNYFKNIIRNKYNHKIPPRIKSESIRIF